jgi:LPS sulfotransferase NodH
VSLERTDWPWRVVVLAHPRSGSNSLVEILERHRSVSIVNEPFNEHYASWDPGNADYASRLRDDGAISNVLDELFAEFTGLKVLSYQLDDASLATLVGRREVKVIALRRRNLLRTGVSQVVAEATGLWKTWDADRDLEDYYRGLPALDIEKVAARMQWSRTEAARVAAVVARLAPGRRVRIDYEDLYESPLDSARGLVSKVWSFLDLEPVDDPAIDHFLSDAVRQARESTYGNIPNLAEVEAELGSDADGHLPDWALPHSER